MPSKEIQPTPEKDQQLLTSASRWSQEIVAKHPSNDTEGESEWVSTGTLDEMDAGIFSRMKVLEKGSETIFELVHMQYGNDVLPENRQRLERFMLAETHDGRFYLEVSSLVPSAAETNLLTPESIEQEYIEALVHDEQVVEDSIHPASSSDIIRFADLVNIATLGTEYLDGVADIDAIDYLVGEWHDEIYGENSEEQSHNRLHTGKQKALLLATDALRTFFKNKRSK